MSKLVIEINLENAAFEDAMELAIILNVLKGQARRGMFPNLCPMPIHDSNGNTCGSVRVEEDESKNTPQE